MKVKTKFAISGVYSICWLIFSLYFAIPWIDEIAVYIPYLLAWIIITGMALIPGVAMSFINMSLLLDKRPKFDKSNFQFPPVTIIVAAYNEEETIISTLKSIIEQDYDNLIDVIVANDGSKDKTVEVVKDYLCTQLVLNKKNVEIRVVSSPVNVGKANVLNLALKYARYEYVVTLDADSVLYEEALQNIVINLDKSGDDYAAVAGTILTKNFNSTAMTKLQDWDYLLGISAVKRIQSMYKATLVAQGAFSIYKRKILVEVNGWPDTIGEDIVLTWAILYKGYKVNHAENAICFTNVPESYKIFYRQRRRWSRGLVEAFRLFPGMLKKRKMMSFFIWYNLMFPYIDTMFIFAFLPGVLIALIFGFHLMAGKMTLYLMPLIFIYSTIIYQIQKKELNRLNISTANKNISFIAYIIFYQIVMTPATLSGYMSEIFKRKRVWK